MEVTYNMLVTTMLVLAAVPAASMLKVAILPLCVTSHPLSMDIITQHLLKRGHQAITIHPNWPKQLEKLKPSPLALYEIQRLLTEEDVQKAYNDNQPASSLIGLLTAQQRYCEAVLLNHTLMQSLQDVDIVVSDALYLCGLVLPNKLNKPFILMSFSGSLFGFHTYYGTYEPASYLPWFGISPPTTVFQRLSNVVLKICVENLFFILNSYYLNSITTKHNISSQLTLHQIRRKYSLTLAAVDFSIEYSRPIPPDIRIIGPVTPQLASPLPSYLEDFMQSSTHGVVVFSLGSSLQIRQDKFTDAVNALGKLKYNVLWKYNKKVNNLPKNVKIVEWMPLNDILGHNKTVAFITHCGSNSLYEGAYHGVPMIGMPAMMEQIGNVGKIQNAGIGIHVDYFTFKVENLIRAIVELTTNVRYRENSVRISHALKSRRRSGRDEAVDWIEYVVKTGGAHHLKTAEADLWFYEYYELDIIAALLFIALVICYLLKSCKKLVWKTNDDKTMKME